MFKDEIKQKLNIKGELMPFCMTMICRNKMMVSGIKSVISSSQTHMRLRLNGEILNISGDDMQIVQIGGGDVYIKGEIRSVEFE